VRRITSTLRHWEPFAQLTDRKLRAEVTSNAQCADGVLDPDEWFPVSVDAEGARREAAGAIAICADCPVRDACLELSLRHWTVGQHGVWGGLVPAERAALRRRRLPAAQNAVGTVSILARSGRREQLIPARR
jgi:Transcription factor WhiB